MTIQLRPYQREALEGCEGWPGIRRSISASKRALLVLPTGCGKTAVFGTFAAERAKAGSRVMVLAHRDELIQQARARLIADTHLAEWQVGVEQGVNRASARQPVVVASVQSLHERRLKTFAPGDFDLIITDEAHHAAARSYQAVFEHFAAADRLGVTATPDRADGKGIGKTFGWPPCYAYDLRQAIADGYLCKLRMFQLPIQSIDLDRVKDLSDDDQLGEEMSRIENVTAVTQGLLGIGLGPAWWQAQLGVGDRPTIVFGTNIIHAEALAKAINHYRPGVAAAVHSKLDPLARRRILADYSAGAIKILVNVGILTEGVDLPLTAAIAMARPTGSRALYSQAIGRGTRLHPSKEYTVVVDFVGNSDKHKLVCALDVMDSGDEDEVRRRVVKRAEEEMVDLDSIVSEEEARLSREKLEAAQRLALEKAKAEYTVVEVDLRDQFAILGVQPRSGRWGGAKATDRQIAALEKIGIDKKTRLKLDRGQASEIIEAAARRREEGLPSLKVSKQLIRCGLRPEMPAEVAQDFIIALKNNEWRPPKAWIAAHPEWRIG